MGLLKRAPKVDVYLPRALFVGNPCDVEIRLECEEELDVEYVDIYIEGSQGWSVGSGKSRATRRETTPTLAKRQIGRASCRERV